MRKEGFAGATVLRGLAGFGARSVVHTTHLLELSQDLPLVIEVVDTEEHVKLLEPILDEMVADGLVTLEKVRVLRYKPGTPRTYRVWRAVKPPAKRIECPPRDPFEPRPHRRSGTDGPGALQPVRSG